MEKEESVIMISGPHKGARRISDIWLKDVSIGSVQLSRAGNSERLPSNIWRALFWQKLHRTCKIKVLSNLTEIDPNIPQFLPHLTWYFFSITIATWWYVVTWALPIDWSTQLPGKRCMYIWWPERGPFHALQRISNAAFCQFWENLALFDRVKHRVWTGFKIITSTSNILIDTPCKMISSALSDMQICLGVSLKGPKQIISEAKYKSALYIEWSLLYMRWLSTLL